MILLTIKELPQPHAFKEALARFIEVAIARYIGPNFLTSDFSAVENAAGHTEITYNGGQEIASTNKVISQMILQGFVSGWVERDKSH